MSLCLIDLKTITYVFPSYRQAARQTQFSGSWERWKDNGISRRILKRPKKLALGEYATRLPVTSSAEIGQLAQDINDLTLALQKTVVARRQWVVDISHELRTPLAILCGEI